MLFTCCRVLVGATLIALGSAVSISGQATVTADLPAILKGAAEKRLGYIDEFKNLLSQETKSFEIYDRKGEVKKRRSVVSTFIVYQLAKKENAVTEFRNVISVDGKNVGDSDKRAQDFFEEVAKADTSNKELEKIDKEGSRFDEEISVNGLTLYQAAVIAEHFRPYFEFTLEETEMMAGRQVYRVAYRQTRDSPYVSLDPKRPATDGKLTLVYDLDLGSPRSTVGRLNGTFWIDTDSLRVRKEKRVLTVRSEDMPAAVPALETVLEYQDSSFEILTPSRLSFTQYIVARKGQESRKELMVVFDYANFTKPDVEVRSADVKD